MRSSCRSWSRKGCTRPKPRIGAPGAPHFLKRAQDALPNAEFVPIGSMEEIFRLCDLQPSLTPVTAVEFGARAKRPAYSVLGHGRLKTLGEDDLRSWRDALVAYLRERNGLKAGMARPGS